MFTSKQNPEIRSADRAMGVAVAAAMAEGGHCAVARAPLTAEGLCAALRAAVARRFLPLPPATPGAFVVAVDAACEARRR